MAEGATEYPKKNPQMQALYPTILSGWPDARKECPAHIQEYWNHHHELSTTRGLIFRDRLVIPKALGSNMLQQLHHGHMGMDKCKECTRDVLFWPGMNRQIEETVSKCTICIEARRANAKEPMLAREVPDMPWQTVATDLFLMDGEMYVVIVDYYSRYFEIEWLQNATSEALIGKTKAVFSRQGIPQKVMSDNGLQYLSADTPGFHNNGVSSISLPALITHSLMDWLRSMCKFLSACSPKQRKMEETPISAFWSIETLQLMV